MKRLSRVVGLSVSALLTGLTPIAAQATMQQCMNEVGYGKNPKLLATRLAERMYCSCISRMAKGRDEHMYCLGMAHTAEWAEQHYAEKQKKTTVNDLMLEALKSNPYSDFAIQPPNISF